VDFDFDGEAFPIFAYVQTDANFTGFELEGDYALWESGERSLKLGATADYVDADTDLGPAARIPPWSVAGTLTWTDARWDAGLEVRHVGEQDAPRRRLSNLAVSIGADIQDAMKTLLSHPDPRHLNSIRVGQGRRRNSNCLHHPLL